MILPSREDLSLIFLVLSRIFLVSARVSMPKSAGMLLRLSQSPSERLREVVGVVLGVVLHDEAARVDAVALEVLEHTPLVARLSLGTP